MSRYHQIDSSIWEVLQEHTMQEKILYIYAFSNTSTRDSGLYVISKATLLLNLQFTEEELDKGLKGLKGLVYYDYENKVMFIPGKLKRRIDTIDKNINLLKSIVSDLDTCKKSELCAVFNERYGNSLPLRGLRGSKRGPLPIPLPLPVPKKNNIYKRKGEGPTKIGEIKI